MSLFPRAFVGAAEPTSSYHPLFRFLDDFDDYNQTSQPTKAHARSHALRTFSPRFDVKELADSYELHGELPGIEQKDVEIEFTDGQTLTIHGRTEHTHTEGQPPAGLTNGGKNGSGSSITEKGESHKPTVEDEEEAKKHESGEGTVATQPEKPQQPRAKYWVSERSVGEFSRTFNFPTNVDHDAVKASMKNGILSVVVPKSKKMGGRKIQIS